MTEKEDRRAQALRANLKRRKTWQRSQKETAKGDEAACEKADKNPESPTDEHKGS